MTPRKLCSCGCGRLAKAGRNYYQGHKPTTLEGRIMAKVRTDPDSGCWVWTGARHPEGYGNVNLGGGRYGSTHRAMYEIHRGPIPAGMDLDHVAARGCTSRACCNPDHLEPVPHRENVRRSSHPSIVASLAGTCTRGHSLAEDGYRRGGDGEIVHCRACRRERATA